MMRWMLLGLFLGVGCLPAMGQVTVTSSPTISTLTTGVVLDVNPSVSADGRYVTMGVRPSFSTLEGFQTFNFSGAVIGPALPFRPAQVGKVTFVDNDKKLLATPVLAMTLKDVSLKEAARKLAETTKSNVVLGIRGLQQAGVDVAAVHTFAVEQGTMKDALLGMLKVAAPETEIVITSEEGVVQVASQAQADNAVVTRTYYLEDLLSNLPRVVSNQTDLNTLKEKVAAGKEKAGEKAVPAGPAGVLPPAVAVVKPRGNPQGKLYETAEPKEGAEKAPASYSTNIVEVITSAVRPEIWKVNGGKIGEIAVVGERVTITAPQSVHALLDGPKHYNPNKVPMYVGYGTR